MLEVIAALAAFVFIILPLVSFLRTVRLQAELRELRQRFHALERQLTPRPAAAPAPPPAEAIRSEPPPLVAPAPEDDEDVEELEGQIGGRLMLYAGMIVLVLGVAFFLRYAFEHEWMSPAVRVALGAVAGSAMAAGGYRLADRYRAYGLFLTGGGLAVLYLSAYAALNLYQLINAPIAFGLLLAITGAAAWLADRTAAPSLALMAVGGGFLTPFLVGGDRDAQITLFSYAALLVGATTYLARRHDWPWLNVASLALTAITVAAWADTYYTADKYLSTELFLTLYCAMFLAILRESRHSTHEHARLVTALLWTAPAAYHLASIAILAPHGIAFPIYLIAVTLAIVIASLQSNAPALRLIGWVAAALPLSGWIEEHRSASWVVGAVSTVLAIYVIHLVAQLRLLASGERIERLDVVLLHANGIGVFAGLHEALLDVTTVPQRALLALVLAGANAGLWWGVRRTNADAALHWLAAAFTLVAIAVALQFDGPWAVAMWATEGVALVWVALRTDREWLRLGALGLIALAIARWLGGDIQATTMAHVAVANARALSGLYLVGLLYLVAWLQRGAPDAAGERRRRERAAVLVAASALTVIVISTEITSFWAVRERVGAQAYLARELMLSAAWAAYAALLVVVGIRRRYPPIRYFAIALFGLTLTKVFVVDLETLGGIYRVVGFVVVGLILLGVSFQYQRVRLGGRKGQPSR